MQAEKGEAMQQQRNDRKRLLEDADTGYSEGSGAPLQGLSTAKLDYVPAKFILQPGINPQRLYAKNYIISHVIGKIEFNKCYRHRYLIFYIPASLVIALQLSMYTGEKSLQSYSLLKLIFRLITDIGKLEPKQISDKEVVNYMTIALNYKKDVGQVKQALRQFLQKYELRMRGFIPIYYLYFKLISQMEELLPQTAGIESAREQIRKVEAEFRKYHDDSI